MTSGLYIHIPFCRSKCAYCDFASYPGMEELIPAYGDALAAEAKRRIRGMTFDTVFIGGGTPTCLPDGELARMAERVLENCLLEGDTLAGDCEFTCEANPNSLTRSKALELKAMGVNRVSVGLQAAQERLLRILGRTHSREDYLRAIDAILDAGIENINTDVIYGVPTQTMEDLEETLALSATPHISAYSLKVEPGTRFHRKGVSEIGEELDRAMYRRVVETLRGRGYRRYEVSNFAQWGYECRHNLKYWRLEPYAGIGAAAHSFVGRKRFGNTPSLEEYIRRNGDAAGEAEQGGDLLELLMLGLRLEEGLGIGDILRREGGAEVMRRAEGLERSGLLRLTDDRVSLTDAGFDLQDHVVIELVR